LKGEHNLHRVAEDPERSDLLCFDCRVYFPRSDYESPYANDKVAHPRLNDIAKDGGKPRVEVTVELIQT
jgi:hypothetical protein